MTTITQTKLVGLDCAECGIRFGVPESWDAKRRQDGRGFFCPNGHPLTFADSENDRLKKKAERLRKEAEAAREQVYHERRGRELAQRRAAAQKGQVTKLKKRSAAGVCPCCKRTVSQLARHMQTKHPKYVEEAHGG